MTKPARGRGGIYPRACPDAAAWRNLSARAALLDTSQGEGRHELLVSLRRWAPPMSIEADDSQLALRLKLREAASAQRAFWRRVRYRDVGRVDFQPMIAAADDIAAALEKRYKDIQSKAWEHWCKKSISEGGSKVIRWIAALERGLQSPLQEDSTSKMGRIQEQWTSMARRLVPQSRCHLQCGTPNILSRV